MRVGDGLGEQAMLGRVPRKTSETLGPVLRRRAIWVGEASVGSAPDRAPRTFHRLQGLQCHLRQRVCHVSSLQCEHPACDRTVQRRDNRSYAPSWPETSAGRTVHAQVPRSISTDLSQLNANKEQVGKTAPSLTVLVFDIRCRCGQSPSAFNGETLPGRNKMAT